MQFSEKDLRSALRRKDPGTSFTQQVMKRVSGEPTGTLTPQLTKGLLRRPWSMPLIVKPALVGACLAVLVVAGSLELAQYKREQEFREGEIAKKQAILALQIATAKLNHVIERMQVEMPSQSKAGEAYEEN
jgi:hypothetical protein